MESLYKRKLGVDDYENLLLNKKHRYEDDEGFEEPLSPMLIPESSPTRADVMATTVLPRLALDLNDFEELTPFYSVVAFSFINWRKNEPLVLFKKVKNLEKENYIIAHKLNEKWVKIFVDPMKESFDRVLYLGNGNYILVNSLNSHLNAYVYKTFNVSRLINSQFQYESNSKLVRTINLGYGFKSWQSNNGIFAVATFNESFGQCRIFSKQGVILFDFNLSSINSTDIPTLNEPYAINLDKNYLYLYYWDSFPLVRISLDSKKIEIIQSELPIVFANHIAISDREAIIGGGCPRSTSMLSLPDYEKSIFRVDLNTCEYEELEVVHQLTGTRLYCIGAQGENVYLRSKQCENLIYVINASSL